MPLKFGNISSFFLYVAVCFVSFFAVSPSFSQRLDSSTRPMIRLEIFCDGQLQPMEAQQWGRELNSLGFQSVQVRAGATADVLDIRSLGGDLYLATAMLTRNNQLQLTGNARFSLSQRSRIRPYLEERILELEQMEQKAQDSAKEMLEGEKSREALFQDLARPVGFRTKGVSRKLVLQKLLKSFRSPLRVPTSLKKAFDDEDRVTEELKNVARGTALAYVLRYLGFCVQAEKNEKGEGFLLRITSATKTDRGKMISIGTAAERATVEELSESFEANVDGASAERILDSLQQRLDIPFLYDYNSMAGLGIEPADVTIRQKSGRFTYKKLLDAVLYQAQLQREVRVDEAGNVFFWITTIKNAR